MANELKHGSVGTQLTQAEWEAIGAHVFDSQATGDIAYASSSSQLSRLGIGEENSFLTVSSSGIPEWVTNLTVGDGDQEDIMVLFDGNAVDFHVGIDDSADDLIIGVGSSLGTTPAITVDGSTRNVTIATDLTISGDDLYMATNTSGYVLVADGTNYNPVAVSGDVTLASTGAITIANDAVESGMLNDNVISGQTELASGGIAAADEIAISDGGTLKKIGVDNLIIDSPALVTEAAIANGDYVLFLDGGATGSAKKEALADMATLFAGTGLTASSSVIGVDASQTQITSVGTIGTGVWQGTAIASGYIAADAITGAKIADDAIDSEHYADGSIDNAHIADDQIDSEHYADGSIDTAHLGNLQVTTAKIAADAIDGTKLADDAVDSEHYTDASIDNAHLADDALGVAELSATGTASSSTFLRGDNSWAAAGGGKLLQVQSALITGSKTNNATTYKACNIVDSITCSATSSKVLVIVSLGNTYNSVRSSGGGITLTRHTAVVADGGAIAGTKIYECNPYLGYMGSEDLSSGLTSMVILDSPSSTSEQFYQVFLRLRTTSGGGTFYIGMGDDLNHSVTLMEIGA